MVNHDLKFIFVHIPKCGGSSIETMFDAWADDNKEKYYIGHPAEYNDTVAEYEKTDQQHLPLSDILKKFPQYSDYFKFTFIRNPFSRIVSEFLYLKKFKRIGVDMTFKQLCSNLENNLKKYATPFHDRLLVDYVSGSNFDYIGRVENFQNDFKHSVCKKIGLTPQIPPHENKSEKKHKHYTEYYDSETREIVAKHYARDIEYFGYKFGE